MVTQPLLSIVIPTKNRSEYCLQAVKSILKYDFDFFEIVVQDNSDTDLLKEELNDLLKDNRLVYNYSSSPLSFVDNFSVAIELTKGEYVCLIGDDDGVCEDLFHTVQWARKNGIDSVCPKVFVNYMWPSTEREGRMVIPYFSNKIWQNNPKENLQSLVNQGIVNYMDFNLPKLYHGVVKKSNLNKIKDKIGSYFGGLTPDIYSSVALSCTVKKHVVLDRPITIAGACPKSATVDSTKGKHSGSLENAPHFRNRGFYEWDDNIPPFYSVQTIWAESAIKALKDFDVKIDYSKLDIVAILATSILAAPQYFDYFKNVTLESKRYSKFPFLFKVYCRMAYEYVKGNLKRIYYRIPRKYILRQLRLTNVTDIQESVDISNKELLRRNIKDVLSRFNEEIRKI